MHVRRLACFFLGAWFAGSLLMALLVTQNPGKAERLMMNLSPNAAAQFNTVPPAQARAILRYHAAERNRDLMETWDTLQLLYGAGFFIFLLFASREGKVSLAAALAMVALVLMQKLFLTPEIADQGRLADFLPADANTADRAKAIVLQNAYWGVEAVKWMAGLGLAGKMVLFSGRLGDSGENLDLVDKPNHGHIYR